MSSSCSSSAEISRFASWMAPWSSPSTAMTRPDLRPGSRCRVRSFAVPALIALVGGALYLSHLERPVPYLTPDELFSGLTAHAVATTGRDLNGRFLPLFFQLPPQYATR